MGAFRSTAVSVALLVSGASCSSQETVGTASLERVANGQRVADYVEGMSDGLSFGVGVGSSDACGQAGQDSIDNLLKEISSDPRVDDVRDGIELGRLAIATGAFTCKDLIDFVSPDGVERVVNPFILADPSMNGYFDNQR
jgi:hypothetical protein